MVDTFINGGATNNYPGKEFTTGTELLTNIRDDSIIAGWTVTTDAIASNDRLLLQGDDATNNCWIELSLATNNSVSNGVDLCLRGDLDGTGASLSPNEIKLLFVDSAINRYWQAINSGAGCISIRSSSGNNVGAHYGFLKRRLLTDTKAWMVGYLDTRIDTAFVAESFHDNTVWRRISDDFHKADEYNVQEQCAPIQGVCDRFTTVLKPNRHYRDTNPNNPGIYADSGMVSGINFLPLQGNYFYIEGRGGEGNYTPDGDKPAKLYNRGDIYFAVTGLGSIPAGSRIQDKDGFWYVSVGNVRWQGFKIL